MSVYFQSPTLDNEVWALDGEIASQFESGKPDFAELRRLQMRRHRLMGRYGFDHTLAINWIILAIGTVGCWVCVELLKAIAQ